MMPAPLAARASAQYWILLAFICLLAARGSAAQTTNSASDPAATLADALSTACRADQTHFADFFTTENAAAFQRLPAQERQRLLQRFSLLDDPGKPLLSSDQDNHTIVRCESSSATTEFHFGAARVHENLAFIPVSVVHSQQADFGLVREGGSWKLLSLGLVLLDIKQLSVQWTESDLAEREGAAMAALEQIAEALEKYKETSGQLPESLAQLGPNAGNRAASDHPPLLDAQLAAGNANGYRFRYRITDSRNSPGAGDRYELEASPDDYGTSGRQSFLRDADGKLHAADKHGAAADAADPIWSAQNSAQ